MPDHPVSEISVTSYETWEHNKKFTVYKIFVSALENSWFVIRRFKEFQHLYEQIKNQFPDVHLKLPARRFFRNLNPTFLEQRRHGLNEFIKQMLDIPKIFDSVHVSEFFMINSSRVQYYSVSSDSVAASDSDQGSDNINLGTSEKSYVKPCDFDFLRVIGKGSFGKVLLARHKIEQKVYAVKVLRKEQVKSRNEIKHVMSERNVLVQNIRHPFLVKLHYSFQTTNKLYFVLDYVNGGELFYHLQRQRLFDEDRVQFYAAEIASALGYLHASGIIYRDLKPENLLLDAKGHVVLTDFGLCKEGLKDRDTTNTFCGTPEYLSPEVLMKKPYDKAVDWWCLGSVLYEMLFGLPPFYHKDHKTMYNNIMFKPLYIQNTISPSAVNLLTELLRKEPKERLGFKTDFIEIKHHSFFETINWEDLEARRIEPPFSPVVANALDIRNIDPEFLSLSIPGTMQVWIIANTT